MKVKDMLIQLEWFVDQVKCCVIFGLIFVEVVKLEKLQVILEQVCVMVEEIVQSYEQLEEVICWYYV